MFGTTLKICDPKCNLSLEINNTFKKIVKQRNNNDIKKEKIYEKFYLKKIQKY